MADIYYYDLSTLLNMNGADASTTFTDESFRTKTWTAAGNAKLTTTGPKFGTAAGTFDGTGDYLSTGSHADFGFGTGAFTVEGWLYQATQTANRCLFDSRTAGNTGIAIMSSVNTPSTQQNRLVVISNTAVMAGDSSTQFTNNTWQHWAVTRDDSGTLRGFIDGALVWSVVDSRTYASASTAYIGTYYDGSQNFLGKMDSVRVTKGYARYTAAFTPPTEAFDGTVPDVNTGTLDLTIDDFAGFGGGAGFADIQYAITGTANGAGHGSATISDFTGAGVSGGFADAEIPPFIGAATGRPSNNGADLRLLAFTSVAYGAGNGVAALNAFAGEAAGTVTNVGHARQMLDAFTSTATGTVTMQGGADARIGAFTSIGHGGGSMAGDIGQFQAYGAGTSGTVGRSTEQRLGDFIGFASGTQENYGGADLTIGDFINGPYAHGDGLILPFVSFGAGGEVVVTTFEGYSVGLSPVGKQKVYPVTRHTAKPFSGMVNWQGNWYGWGPAGLYLIGGDDDDGAAISWAWNTGITNFGSRQMKAVRETFIHGRLGPSATAKVSIGEAADVTYAAVIERGSNAQAHRIKYGRGLKAEYWSFGLADATGSAMEVDSMQHEPQPLSRKI